MLKNEKRKNKMKKTHFFENEIVRTVDAMNDLTEQALEFINFYLSVNDDFPCVKEFREEFNKLSYLSTNDKFVDKVEFLGFDQERRLKCLGYRNSTIRVSHEERYYYDDDDDEWPDFGDEFKEAAYDISTVYEDRDICLRFRLNFDLNDFTDPSLTKERWRNEREIRQKNTDIEELKKKEEELKKSLESVRNELKEKHNVLK
jgi:hypothetical protein